MTSEQNKILLLQKWSRWLFEKSFWASSAALASEVAYLLTAIIHDGIIELNHKSKLFRTLKEESIENSDLIWSFIKLEDEMQCEFCIQNTDAKTIHWVNGRWIGTCCV